MAAEGDALGWYRQLLLPTFDQRLLGRLYSDLFKVPLSYDVDEDTDLTDLIQRTLESCAQRGRALAQLLARAIRVRADHAEFVDQLAPRLGLAPVIEVADLLAQFQCPKESRERIALSIDSTAGAHRIIYHRGGRDAWIDILVYLEELPERCKHRPPLLDFLEHIEAEWRASNALGAANLSRWIARQRVTRGIPASAERQASRETLGILIELETLAGWSFTAWLFGDMDTPSMMLGAHTISTPESEAAQRDAFVTAIENYLTHESVARLIAAGVELRCEFVLPPDWISMPLDQLLIADEDEKTRLGARHPVSIRPTSWLRPQTAIAKGRFRRKREYLQGAGPPRIVPLRCPTDRDEIERINECDDVVAVALTCSTETMGDPVKLRACLRAHVLSIVWLRGGCVPEFAMFERLLTPLSDAPRSVRRWRLGYEENRDQLSLIWHVEPIELSDLQLTSPQRT